MIDPAFIERLIRALDESGVDSLEIERGGTRVRLAKTPTGTASVAVPHHGAPGGAAGSTPAPAAPGAPPEPAPPAPGREQLEITSPMVGTFYRAPAPDAPPYVQTGTKIGPGDTLCIIEAMKLMNELESEVSGTVAEVCVENAQPVEFGQVLFRVDPR
jgi:acetyl-CoA carboxylase biotin carboxyl carrier protein